MANHAGFAMQLSYFYQILQFCTKLLPWQVFANVMAKWYSVLFSYLIRGAPANVAWVADDALT